MARYRRRKKSSPFKTFCLWAAGLSLVGWGLWQAMEFRNVLIADFKKSQAANEELAAEEVTTRPSIAVGAMTVTRRDFTTRSARTAPRPDITADQITIELADLITEEPFTLREAALAHHHALRIAQHAVIIPAFDAALTPAELIASANASLESGRIAEGRAALNAALSRTQDDTQADSLRQSLADLNAPIFLGSEIMPEDPLAFTIDIEPGDSFLKLGREFNLPAPYLQAINPSLNPRNLKPLTGLKVVQGPFHLTLVKHASRLDLALSDMYVKSYPVELPEGNFLPKGDYHILAGSKIQVADHCWIGFEGTEEPTQSVENGWFYGSWGPRGNSTRNRATGVILQDSDLQQLYNIVVEIHSQLHVLP